jgi:RNA polymerase sigma-70 factor (ECF subfamily)
MERSDLNAGERGAFERLVEELADRVYNIALRITGDTNDAEDATQEAFLAAWRGWGGFRHQSSPTTWLYRIAVNSALQRVRRRRPTDYLTDIDDEASVQDWSASVAELAEQGELRDLVLGGLAQLEPEQRAALVIRDIDGLSTAEAAEVLDISVPALKSRLHRARAALRQHLADYFGER